MTELSQSLPDTPSLFSHKALGAPLPAGTALVIIDLQRAIDDPRWGRRNNPAAEAKAARLLAAWRLSGRPAVHVQRLGRRPDSPYRPGQPGCEFKAAVRPRAGEFVIQKCGDDAFTDTGLKPFLDERGIDTLVAVGLFTQGAVEATVRTAGALGYRTYLAADATASRERVDLAGRRWSAEEVQALTLAHLDGDYATVTDSAALLAAL